MVCFLHVAVNLQQRRWKVSVHPSGPWCDHVRVKQCRSLLLLWRCPSCPTAGIHYPPATTHPSIYVYDFLISRSGIMLTREREKIIYTLCSFPITIQKSLIIRFVGPTKDVGKKSRSRVETTSNHTAGNRWMRTRYGRECWEKDFGSTWIKVWTTELWLTYNNITAPSCPFT